MMIYSTIFDDDLLKFTSHLLWTSFISDLILGYVLFWNVFEKLKIYLCDVTHVIRLLLAFNIIPFFALLLTFYAFKWILFSFSYFFSLTFSYFCTHFLFTSIFYTLFLYHIQIVPFFFDIRKTNNKNKLNIWVKHEKVSFPVYYYY